MPVGQELVIGDDLVDERYQIGRLIPQSKHGRPRDKADFQWCTAAPQWRTGCHAPGIGAARRRLNVMNAQEETGILSARRPWALDVARVGVVEICPTRPSPNTPSRPRAIPASIWPHPSLARNTPDRGLPRPRLRGAERAYERRQGAGGSIATHCSKRGVPRRVHGSGTPHLARCVAWDADVVVDLAFAALWFSHVPLERLPPMLSVLRRAVRPGSQLCIIDKPDTSPARPPAAQDAHLELRELRDGRQFEIVKIYRSPQQLMALCMDAGFTQVTDIPGIYFFGLIAQCASSERRTDMGLVTVPALQGNAYRLDVALTGSAARAVDELVW
jgi:hypothetical protein